MSCGCRSGTRRRPCEARSANLDYNPRMFCPRKLAPGRFRLIHAGVLLAPICFTLPARAQEALPAKPEANAAKQQSARDPQSAHASDNRTARIDPRPAHRFWDTQNSWLFAGVAAARALDYHSTGNMRRRGRDEILLTNDVVDNHSAFATIEAAATLTSVGVSYLFHRKGHHQLERWVSIVHGGIAFSGAARNYALMTCHVQAGGACP